MYAEERQQVILERARTNGRVDVGELAEEFTVTTETIRRDLTILERHGVLRRVHGGGIPVDQLGFEPAMAARSAVMTAAKARIARAAVAELPDQGSILLDAGSTTMHLAERLPRGRELTVVTHSVDIALRLSTQPNLTVMLAGGRLRRRTLATVDSWALHALDEILVDIAFIATNGVSVEHGLTTPDSTGAIVKRAVISSARRCVLLADHTKVGNDHFTRFAKLEDIDTFITDDGIDALTAEEIANAGPRIIKA